MTIQVRRAADRGRAEHGWLGSRHTFSFGDYYDPRFMGFGNLRVINEDRVQAGQGFQTHSHRDMEIITYVLEGALEHRDSLGTGSVIRPGQVQRMSAGTGVQHSEFNHSGSDPVHFLQIWILPATLGIEPGYAEKSFPDAEKRDNLKLLVSRSGRNDSISINQDMDLFATLLSKGRSVHHDLAARHSAWIQVAQGDVMVNKTPLAAGDGAAITDESRISIQGVTDSEILVFRST